MELPVFPDELKCVLTCLDTTGKELSWNIQRSSKKVVLNLVWKVTSKCPPSEVKPQIFAPSKKSLKPAGKPVVLSEKPPSAACAGQPSQPGAKKKKSPSRLARDRKRLLLFKERKKEQRSQLHTQEQEPSIDFTCRVIQYKNTIKRTFLYHYPFTIPVNATTTASDVKKCIINSLEKFDKNVPDPSCITLIQPVGEGDQPSTPMWVVPDRMCLYQVYANSTLPKRMFFDICMDEPAADDCMYYSSEGGDSDSWETDSTASQLDGSLD